jgi:hypothetical protein
MSKDFRSAAIAASIAIGTPSVLLSPVAHAAVNGANDAILTEVEARLASSANPDHASVQARAILLAALSAMDPQQKRELAIDRIPAPNVRRVYELEAAAGCKTLSCVCTDCCISYTGLPSKGRSPPNASPPKGQSRSNPSIPRGQSPSNPSLPRGQSAPSFPKGGAKH